ncbi:MAG: hypothetical protein ABIO39_09665 [Caulobacteraceae bacterium]
MQAGRISRAAGKPLREGDIFARPWTTVVRYTKRPGHQIPEQVCADGLGR